MFDLQDNKMAICKYKKSTLQNEIQHSQYKKHYKTESCHKMPN